MLRNIESKIEKRRERDKEEMEYKGKKINNTF
jgi:hypothetical protein